jgi:hypothetical protein
MWGFFYAQLPAKLLASASATSRHLSGQTRILIYQGFCTTGKNSNN